jgi:hypothetical protein
MRSSGRISFQKSFYFSQLLTTKVLDPFIEDLSKGGHRIAGIRCLIPVSTSSQLLTLKSID